MADFIQKVHNFSTVEERYKLSAYLIALISVVYLAIIIRVIKWSAINNVRS